MEDYSGNTFLEFSSYVDTLLVKYKEDNISVEEVAQQLWVWLNKNISCNNKTLELKYADSVDSSKKEVNYNEKAKIANKMELTLKDIMRLYSVGQPTATIIRNEAIEYCKQNNIKVYGRKVPTEAVLSVRDKDINFFLNKCNVENQIIELDGGKNEK